MASNDDIPGDDPFFEKLKDLRCKCLKEVDPVANHVLATRPGVKEFKESDSCCQSLDLPADVTMLTTGFGMRSISSLERALKEAQRRAYLAELAKDYDSTIPEESGATSARGTEPSTHLPTESSLTESTAFLIQPPNTAATTIRPGDFKAELLDYGEGEELKSVSSGIDEDQDFLDEKNPRMRRAKRYLRNHRISEFFRFLAAKLVISKSDNPITFLLNLLDKILLYRCGLGIAPVLYDKVHIEQLFNLMDRMGTGYVDEDQYVTAMHTLGICSYNRSPLKNCEGLIAKETFIEEVFDAEIQIFNDVIRRRVHVKPPPPTMPMKDFLSQAEPEGESLDAYKIDDTGADRTSHPIDDTTLSFTDLSAAI